MHSGDSNQQEHKVCYNTRTDISYITLKAVFRYFILSYLECGANEGKHRRYAN